MSKTSDFILKAQHIHGDKYDYSLVEYVYAKLKVKIICSTHGVFEQTPSKHHKGANCPSCSNIKRGQVNTKSLDEFIAQANHIHHYKYNYTLVDYNRADVNVDIICPTHGIFQQRPANHIHRQTGCPRCKSGNIKQTKKQKYGNENYNNIEKRKQTCVDVYGVDNPQKRTDIRNKFRQTMLERYGVEYTGLNQSLRIKQIQSSMEKYGIEYYQQKHILDIIPILLNFDIMYHKYIIEQKSSIVIGKELGIDKQTVLKYLRDLEIEIRQEHYSYISILWLEQQSTKFSCNIMHGKNGGEYSIPGTLYFADGYCEETNTIYEFHGDFWHGNPQIYSSDMIHPILEHVTMGELYQKTIDREQKIKELGYNLVVMWESDFYNELS